MMNILKTTKWQEREQSTQQKAWILMINFLQNFYVIRNSEKFSKI